MLKFKVKVIPSESPTKEMLQIVASKGNFSDEDSVSTELECHLDAMKLSLYLENSLNDLMDDYNNKMESL